MTQLGEPGWIISLSKWGAEFWWHAGDIAASRRLTSTPQHAFRFDTKTAAESVAQTFRDAGDRDVEVLEFT